MDKFSITMEMEEWEEEWLILIRRDVDFELKKNIPDLKGNVCH